MTSIAYADVHEKVTAAAGRYARDHSSLVNGVSSAIAERGTVQAGKDYLGACGYGGYAYLLDSVTLDSVNVESFDKATACEVIRAFLTDGRHLQSAGEDAHPDEDVTALLQIAGLEDVPEPEPEAQEEQSVDAGLFHRLVQFARGHGFRG